MKVKYYITKILKDIINELGENESSLAMPRASGRERFTWYKCLIINICILL